MKKIFKRIITFIIILIIFNLLFTSYFYVICNNYAKYPDEKCDIGIVFFHSINKNKELSKESKERLDYTFELYKNKFISKILCVGGGDLGLNTKGSLLMKQYLVKQFVPDSLVLSDTISFSTYTNLIQANKIINNLETKKIIFISSPTHIPRILFIANNISFTGLATSKWHDFNHFDFWYDSNLEYLKFVAFYFPESINKYLRNLFNSIL